MRTINNHELVFLCGLHRSGTSPLFRLLREHPSVSGFSDTGVPEDEGQHLQTVFPAAMAHGGPGRFGFCEAAHLTEMSALVTADNRRRLFAEWSRYWDLGRQYLLEKSPPNLIRTRFLQAIFPNAHFIVISRHPIAVSLATQKWSRSGLEELLQHWIHCHRLFESDRPYLNRSLLISYEDLIKASAPNLQRICEFLGLQPHPFAALDPAGNERYFYAWRNLSSQPEGAALVRHLATKYEDQVRHFGYSLVE